MSNDVTSQIHARVEQFITELEAVVRQAALETVQQALGDGATPARSRGRPRGPHARTAAPPQLGRSKGEKRTPEQMETTVSSLYGAIKSKPGQRIEEIAAKLGTSTKELALPARKLIADRRVSTKGVKRAMRYFPK